MLYKHCDKYFKTSISLLSQEENPEVLFTCFQNVHLSVRAWFKCSRPCADPLDTKKRCSWISVVSKMFWNSCGLQFPFTFSLVSPFHFCFQSESHIDYHSCIGSWENRFLFSSNIVNHVKGDIYLIKAFHRCSSL